MYLTFDQPDFSHGVSWLAAQTEGSLLLHEKAVPIKSVSGASVGQVNSSHYVQAVWRADDLQLYASITIVQISSTHGHCA